jgi:hypothetical protein
VVVVDSTMLLLLLQPGAGGPSDAAGEPITLPRERLERLISELDKAGDRVMIPTPVLSEVLVKAPAGQAPLIVEALLKQTVCRIEPFDALAAIEVAQMSRADLDSGKKARRGGPETVAKIKYDRQIVAMAKVAQVTAIYSDDGGLRAAAKRAGIRVIGLGDLALPEETAQKDLFEAGQAPPQ